MKNHLELISLEKLYPEKRHITLPRYPIPQLTFKQNTGLYDHIRSHGLEVRDISATGIQLENKLHAINWEIGSTIEGYLKFAQDKIFISGEVVWVKQGRAGLRFKKTEIQQEILNKVLNIPLLIKSLKPLHVNLLHEKPLDLRYWLQASGPLEFMVWGTQADPLSSCLWIYSHFFVQWTDSEGVKTGKIYRQRGEDEWNLMEGERVLLFDRELNDELIKKLTLFYKTLDQSLFYDDDYTILKTKLRCY